MSRHELERLVGDAEVDADLRQQLRQCRSQEALVLVARRLGYRVTSRDLLQARWEHQQHPEADAQPMALESPQR